VAAEIAEGDRELVILDLGKETLEAPPTTRVSEETLPQRLGRRT
jgi:hypothetical protein